MKQKNLLLSAVVAGSFASQAGARPARWPDLNAAVNCTQPAFLCSQEEAPAVILGGELPAKTLTPLVHGSKGAPKTLQVELIKKSPVSDARGSRSDEIGRPSANTFFADPIAWFFNLFKQHGAGSE